MGYLVTMRLPSFISFEDSYVLSINAAPYNIVLEVDFALLPGHEFYSQPRQDESEYFFKGQLRVDGFDRILWSATKFSPSEDAAGDIDFGTFDEIIYSNNLLKLVGDWGELEITGGALSICIEREDGRMAR